MDEIINLIATDSAPTSISDRIKEILFAKTGERIENLRPEISSVMFGGEESENNPSESPEEDI